MTAVKKSTGSIRRQGTNGEMGSGLGLIICKNLIEKQKGKLEVESTEGVGTSVFVYLPK